MRRAFSFSLAALKGRALGRSIPLNVMWRLTNTCNARCSYCSIWKKKSPDLPLKTIIRLIDEMADAGTRRIGFVGGEALLREDFGDILDHARSRGLYVTLVSNGCLVPEKIEVVKRLDHLVISFDGRKENHERGRMKESYRKALSGISAARAENVKVLTNTVLTKYNLDDIDFILEKAHAYGFHCTFNLLQGKSDCYATDDDYRRALFHLRKRKLEGRPIVLSLKTIDFLLGWPSYQRFITRRPVRGFRCWAGRFICNIDTDGTVAKCDILTHRIGNNPNAATLGFLEAFRSIRNHPCKACTCSHVIEYNHMFSFSPTVIMDWAKVIFR